MSLSVPKRINSRLVSDMALAVCILALTSAISVCIGLFMHSDQLEGWGSWLGAFISCIALVISSYAILIQARQGESTSWNIALGRLGELYDVAYKDARLASFIAEPSDPQGTLAPVDIQLSPQENVWLGSLFLAFEQIYVATLALSPESQRVWRLYLRNQLNKPSLRAAFVRDALNAKDYHNEFWKFVRGIPCNRDPSGYRNYAIHPRYFRMPDRISSKQNKPANIHIEAFSTTHAKFWLEMYRDEAVKKQMYAAPIFSEDDFIKYIKSRSAYTVFMDDRPIGGFTLSAEKDRIGTFGFVIHSDWRGKGLSHEIIKRIEQKARDQGLHTLRGDVYIDNYPCIRALESNGFRRFIWFEKNLNSD